MTATQLTIPHRFCGPPSSGNGGWTAGVLAGEVLARSGAEPSATVAVRLHRPPPLDVPLDLVADGGTDGSLSLVTADGDPVATGGLSDRTAEGVEPVATDAARDAEARFAGLTSHPFPTCFGCGTAREPGDGLRIFPGRIDDDAEGRARVAATWTAPDQTDVADEPFGFGWAALDCVGGWAGDLGERHLVLGSMTAALLERPEPGRGYVVVGGDRGTEGRKTRTASSLHADDGRLLGWAEHVWIAIDPKDFA